MTEPTYTPAFAAAFRKAVDLYNTGNFDAAAAAGEQVVALDKGFADGWHLLANVAARQGAFDRAATLLDVVLTLEADHAPALKGRAEIELMRGQPAGAEALYRRVLDSNARDAVALFGVAISLQQQGKLDEAAAAYRRHLRIDLGAPAALVNLGVIALDKGELSEAAKLFGLALQRAPGDFGALTNLAMVSFRDAPGDALGFVLEAVNRAPQSPQPYLAAAFMLRFAGRDADAERCYAALPPEHVSRQAARASHDVALGIRATATLVGSGWQVLEAALAAAPADTSSLILDDTHGAVTKSVAASGRTPIFGPDESGHGALGLLRIAGDEDAAVQRVLNRVKGVLVPGAVVVVERYFGYPGWTEGAPRAIERWRQETGREIEFLALNPLGTQAALRVVSPLSQPGADQPSA